MVGARIVKIAVGIKVDDETMQKHLKIYAGDFQNWLLSGRDISGPFGCTYRSNSPGVFVIEANNWAKIDAAKKALANPDSVSVSYKEGSYP